MQNPGHASSASPSHCSPGSTTSLPQNGIGLGVGVGVSPVAVGVSVGVSVGVAVGVPVAVTVAVGVAVGVGVFVRGNVGVGVTTPATRLHVNGSNDGADVLVSDGEFANMQMAASNPASDVLLTVQARGSAVVQRAEIGTTSNHDVVLFSNGDILMYLRANGEVCLGSGCP